MQSRREATTTSSGVAPYRTDDLHQAAYLWCHGLEPQLLPLGSNRVQFAFHESGAAALVNEYVRGNARVEPLRFSAAVRELKRRAREQIG
jgi:hypothetical protein